MTPQDDALRCELLLAREAINRSLGNRQSREHDLRELQQSQTFSADSQTRCRVLERLANLRQETGDRRGEHEAIRALGEQANSLADDHWKAVVFELSARYQTSIGSYGDARTASMSAAALYERLGEVAGQINALGVACQTAAYLFDFAAAAEGLNRMDELARHSEAANLVALAARTRAIVAIKRQDYEAGQAAAVVALELHRSIGDRYGEASGHALLGVLAGAMWRIDGARRHYAFACGLFETLGNPHGLGQASMNAAGLEADLGCFDEARRLAERACALAETAGEIPLLEIYTTNMASLALSSGDYALCLKICQGAKELSDDMVSLARLALAAQAEVMLGDFGAAIETLEKVIPEFRRYNFFSAAYDALIFLTQAYLATAKFDDAWRCVDDLLHEMTALGEVYPRMYRPRVLWLAGRACAATNQVERAREMYREAQNVLEEMRTAIPDEETRACFSAVPFHLEIDAAFV
ncbi:MAG: hypothetical protein JO113_01525 [Candidatus Eremiobacteraeota bacterium]|nr:hypothetical protein [Candidatus Eremiobacteraeota bacterium]